MPKRTEMVLLVPTKAFYKWAHADIAMLFAPFRCTHPPPPVLPFLLTQNLSSKDISGSDMMKLKVSQHHMQSLGRKGLNRIRILIRSVHLCSCEAILINEPSMQLSLQWQRGWTTCHEYWYFNMQLIIHFRNRTSGLHAPCSKLTWIRIQPGVQPASCIDEASSIHILEN